MSCRILSWTALDPLRSLTILFWTQFLLLLLNHINPIRELSGCSVMGACAAQCPSQNFGSPSLKNLLHPQGYLYWRNFNRFGEKTQTLFHHWRNFNLLERKLTLSRENSNSRSLFKIKKKKKQLHCCRMCTSNAAVTQSGITLFVVLWIHCHVISSVGVKNMNPEQLRAFYSAHFRLFKVRYSKALRAGDILYLKNNWIKNTTKRIQVKI